MACLAVLACLGTASHVQSQVTTGVPDVLPKVDSSRLANFVVIPGCVTSHWYQALAIIQELSKRGHKVQVSSSNEFRFVVHLQASAQVQRNPLLFNSLRYQACA